MKIAICSDHRGFRAKECLKAVLGREGHQLEDFGCNDDNSCDYPDTAIPAARSVAQGSNQAAIMICGTGIGMSMTANKMPGVRAALCHDELTAELARKHNDANTLCLPGDLLGDELMKRVVEVWINTPFEGGRHQRRIDKIRTFEITNCTKSTDEGHKSVGA